VNERKASKIEMFLNKKGDEEVMATTRRRTRSTKD